MSNELLQSVPAAAITLAKGGDILKSLPFVLRLEHNTLLFNPTLTTSPEQFGVAESMVGLSGSTILAVPPPVVPLLKDRE